MLVMDTPDVWEKIKNIQKSCEFLVQGGSAPVPQWPARDVQVLDSKLHPPKKGFSLKEGQARMLHDLASIELQAMELGVRTLAEFPDAPQAFREELMAVTVSEGTHLRLCLEGIHDLGFKWGDWPVHCALWGAVSAEDSLLDRILIVHRYLEGSGLDAGSYLIQRLDGIDDGKHTRKIVGQINFEEIGHVDFGSQWYRKICQLEKIDASVDFPRRMESLRWKLPKRMEKINRDLRLKAGFTEEEILACEAYRESILPSRQKLASATSVR
ncbi:DUF455 family protein [Bdellovibrio sp. HCB337]|uniref:DUF455 family protein n=1 Tax=Bdellovibrio sp. HCB337 TaxID=3394358 RepID=UPI0039A4F5AB